MNKKWLLLMALCFQISWSQEKYIVLKWVDWQIVTDSKVCCSDYEDSFDFKMVKIENEEIIDSVKNQIIKINSTDLCSKVTPDVRIKIEIHEIDSTYTICLSDADIMINEKPKKFCLSFFDFILQLISRLE